MKQPARVLFDCGLVLIYLPLMYLCLTYYFGGYIAVAEWLSNRSVLLLILAGTAVGSLVFFLFAFLLSKAFAFAIGLIKTKPLKNISQWLTIIITGFSGIQLLVITWKYLDFSISSHLVTFLLFLFGALVTIGYIAFFVTSEPKMKEQKVQLDDDRYKLKGLDNL